MDFTLIEVSYMIGVDPATLVVRTPLGSLERWPTNQSAINAKRADTGVPWTDVDALAVATDLLAARYPDITGATVALYSPTEGGGA